MKYLQSALASALLLGGVLFLFGVLEVVSYHTADLDLGERLLNSRHKGNSHELAWEKGAFIETHYTVRLNLWFLPKNPG